MKISSFVEGRPQTDGEKSGEMKHNLWLFWLGWGLARQQPPASNGGVVRML